MISPLSPYLFLPCFVLMFAEWCLLRKLLGDKPYDIYLGTIVVGMVLACIPVVNLIVVFALTILTLAVACTNFVKWFPFKKKLSDLFPKKEVKARAWDDRRM